MTAPGSLAMTPRIRFGAAVWSRSAAVAVFARVRAPPSAPAWGEEQTLAHEVFDK